MPVRVFLTEEMLTAHLIGEIDHHAAKKMREEIDEAASRSRPATLVLDFKDVTFMDSSGIGLVMGRYALMRDLEGDLAVENMPGHIKKVMRLAGLDKLAGIENGGRAK